MLIHGDRRPTRANARVVGFIAVCGLGLVACGLSYVAGGEAYRQGRFHVLREYAQAAMKPAHRVRAWLKAPQAPVLAIDMKFKHVRTIQQLREQALTLGTIAGSDDGFVPATLRMGDEILKVKMRLKGHALDHLRGRKWSYRVEFKDGGQLWGMRGFALQHPGTRGFEREWLFHRHLQHEGVLGLRYGFVRVVFNGDDLGLYALEERFSKELLEAQGRREGPIIKFQDEGRLERRTRGVGAGLTAGDFAAAGVTTFRSKSIAGSPTLSAQRDAGVQLFWAFAQGELPASQVFKVPQLARYMALCELYGSWHGLAYHNMRFYYDPVEARLEPIGYDANSSLESNRGDLQALGMPWSAAILEDPLVARAYAAELARLSHPEYLPGIQAALDDELDQTVLLLNREWPIDASTVWRSIARRQQELRRMITVGHIVRGRITANGTDSRTLEIFNNLRLPVELLALHAGDTTIPLTDSGVAPLLPGTPAGEVGTPFTRTLALGENTAAQVAVECRIAGLEVSQRVALTRHDFAMPAGGSRPTAPTLAEAVAQHEFLKRTPDANLLRVEPGDWAVTGDLVLPDGVGLTAGPATTLRFEPGAVLSGTGAINLTGTAEHPVRLLPQLQSWSGVLVLNAPVSEWSHVHVEATTGIDRHGWMTTGGVTFSRAPVRIDECRFSNSLAEDALNVLDARIQLTGTAFTQCASDAFDGDFVSGRIDGCRYHDIGGDAIDVSASKMLITQVEVRGVGDKAVSAGEKSDVEVSSLTVIGAAMGLVSKDHSTLRALDVHIRDTGIGLAAYVKKREYGPASIDASGVSFERVSRARGGRGGPLCERGTMIRMRPIVSGPTDPAPDARQYRYEIKFATEPTALPIVRSWIRLHPAAFRRAYPPRLVNSLYFDTATWASLEDNLAGIAERDKLRVRWYGPDLNRIEGSMELKAKRGELGTKIAVALDRPLTLDDRRWADIVRDLRSRTLGPLAAAAGRKNLPIVLIQYRREYLITADGSSRLTMDSEIRTFDQTRSGRPDLRRVIPAEPTLIVELKGDAGDRRSLEAVAAQLPLTRVAYSKYTRGVLTALGQAELAAGALGRLTAPAKKAPGELRLAA